jgi:integrase
MSDWFTKQVNPKTARNILENETRSKRIIRNIFGSSEYKIKNEAEFSRFIDVCLNSHEPTVVARIAKYINIHNTVSPFDLKVVTRKLKQLKSRSHSNFLSTEDFTKLFNQALKLLETNQTTNQDQTNYLCIFMLCALFGLRRSDALSLDAENLTFLLATKRLIIETHKTKSHQIIECNDPTTQHIVRIILTHLNKLGGKFQDVKLAELFTQHYVTTLNKKKPKQLGFHALRFRFSALTYNFEAGDKTIVINTKEDPFELNDLSKHLGHTNVGTSNFYRQTELGHQYDIQKEAIDRNPQFQYNIQPVDQPVFQYNIQPVQQQAETFAKPLLQQQPVTQPVAETFVKPLLQQQPVAQPVAETFVKPLLQQQPNYDFQTDDYNSLLQNQLQL